MATSYLLGVSTRRMERLVATLGITGLSKSQVSQMAKDLDAQVQAFRTRPLDAGPYTFLAADALTVRVREGGRVIKVAAMVATGVNAEGYREILGLQLSTSEDGAGWLGFFRDLCARGLTGVALVTSDAHAGLVDAIGATLPGAGWQRSSVNMGGGGAVPPVREAVTSSGSSHPLRNASLPASNSSCSRLIRGESSVTVPPLDRWAVGALRDTSILTHRPRLCRTDDRCPRPSWSFRDHR